MPGAWGPLREYTKMSLDELTEKFSISALGTPGLEAIRIELERRAHIAQIEAAQAAKEAADAQKAAADAQKDAAKWTKRSAIGVFLTVLVSAIGIYMKS